MVLCAVTGVHAENGMNSPYTRFGFGQLSIPECGVHRAMGGTGIGLRAVNQIDLLNPASYSTVDTLTFALDMGMSVQNTNFAEGTARRNARNATFDWLAFQYRLHRGLGMTVSYTPVSNIGYRYSSVNNIRNDEDGALTATDTYNGDGGLHRVAVGLGWSPMKWLSIGADAAYIYGYTEHTVSSVFSQTGVDSRYKIYYADLSGATFNAGAQVSFGNKKNRFVAGATYNPALAFSQTPYSVDYILTSNAANIADTVRYAKLTLPEKYGLGVSYTRDNKLTLAADLTLSRYGSTSFFGQPGLDHWRASLGAEYVPVYNRHYFFTTLRYRAGLYYSTAYYTVKGGRGPSEFGASVGFGLPIINSWNQRSTVNVSGQFVRTQPAMPGMIAENVMRLNVSVSFIEDWFTKWRVN